MKRGRQEVASFARRMLFTCEPDWKAASLDELEGKLNEKYVKLKQELEELRCVRYDPSKCTPMFIIRDLRDRCNRVSAEATNLANVTMMITDKVGGLDD